MFDRSFRVMLLTTHFSVLATNVEVLSGTSPFFWEVVSSARVAFVSQSAAGVRVDHRIFVICQAQDCSCFATDTRGVDLAKPLPFQVFPTSSLATKKPLACGSRLSAHSRRLFRIEALPFCRVSSNHQVIAEKY